MRGDGELFAPLVAVRVVAVEVDQNPGRAALAQDAEDFAQAARRVGPVVGRLHRDDLGEEVGVPGDFVHTADYKHQVVKIDAGDAGAVNHLVGDVHADDAAFGDALGQHPRKPASAAADVEHVVVGRELHAVERGEDDGKMVVLHGLAAAGFGPAVEFVAKLIAGRHQLR